MPDAVYKQSLDNAATIIQGLDLDGVADDEIVVRKFAWDDTHPPHKGITISWDDEKESEGTNCRDDIGYPLIVTMVQGSDRGWSTGMDRITLWRQSIRRAFHNKRPLTTVSATDVNPLPCKVLHAEVELPDKYKKNYDVGRLIIMAWFREPRT